MKEIWKNIPEYVGIYEISNLGNIRSVYNNNKPLKLSIGKNKYVTVSLYKNKIGKTFNVHRLVAQVFIPNPNNLPCVNHKDENRSNNCVDNLEWCTYLYNNIKYNFNKILYYHYIFYTNQ